MIWEGNGATTFKYFYNDGGTVNFNADVTITKEAENGNAEILLQQLSQ